MKESYIIIFLNKIFIVLFNDVYFNRNLLFIILCKWFNFK